MLNTIIGFLSGIISGMGIGGGAILIPALIMAEKISQKVAQGINLAYFIPTALCALIVHLKNKSIKLKTALVLGLFGVPGAILGSFFAGALQGSALRRMFGGFLLLVGIYEIRKGLRDKIC